MILLDFRTNGFAAFQLHNGEFLPSVENGSNTLRLVAANGVLELGGPSGPGNTLDDTTNPYDWGMGQPDRDRLGAWLASYTGGDVTLRICTGTTISQGHRVFAVLPKFNAPTFDVTVETRPRVRKAIEASQTLPAITGVVPIRKPERREVEASKILARAHERYYGRRAGISY